MATITSVSGSDTPNTGKTKWNTNDTNINAEVVQATADIVTHKASSDHDTHNDARYSGVSHNHTGVYAPIAAPVNVTGAQTVAGTKTLTSDPIVATGNTSAVVLQTAALGNIARVRGAVNGADMGVHLDAYSPTGAQFKEMIRGYADDETVDTPYADLYCRGKAVATQEYVDQRVKGFRVMGNFSHAVDPIVASTTYTLSPSLLCVPPNARLMQVMWGISLWDDRTDYTTRAVTPTLYTFAQYYNSIRVKVVIGANVGGNVSVTLKIYSYNADVEIEAYSLELYAAVAIATDNNLILNVGLVLAV